MGVMTFLSDFGIKNSYAAQMKAVASYLTDCKIVDITHDITPHDIREGAYVLMTSTPYFPIGTVHVAVVDPGVGTDRRGIVITTNTQILVGPDNGLLIPAARYLGEFTVYEIRNSDFMLKTVSNTFHGRDIFTPVAAHILNGALFEEIGPVIKDFVDLDFGKCEITDKTASGKVSYIDSFGNIITNITGFKLKQFLDYNKKIMLFIGNKQKRMLFAETYDHVKKGELLATIGSSNLLEISCNKGKAAKKLGVKLNDEVKILFS
jgi:S-adenosylmethionine hydrolase